MKPWSAFLKDVRPDAPGFPEPIVEHAVLRAAQDFCDMTRAWKVELDPVPTEEGVLVYDLPLDRAELVRLESATLNGKDYGIWRPGDRARGHFVFTPDSKTVQLSAGVGAGLPLVLTCSVKPSNGATGCDDAIFDRYVSEISAGAIARLTKDPSKRLDFEGMCDRIKTRLWRGNAAVRPRTQANFF